MTVNDDIAELEVVLDQVVWLVQEGECSAGCLLALSYDEDDCDCRCRGRWHSFLPRRRDVYLNRQYAAFQAVGA